jgi:hypothetical protein
MEKAFVFKMKTIHTSGCMVSKKIPFYYLRLYVIDILSQKFFRQYKTWCITFDRKRKRQFISFPFQVGDTRVKNLAHLKEVSEILSAFDLKEAEPLSGFDPQGLFSQHLKSIRYSNLFTQFDEETR